MASIFDADSKTGLTGVETLLGNVVLPGQLNFNANNDKFNGWNYLDNNYDYDKEKPRKYIPRTHVLDEFCSDDMIKNTCVEELYNFADDCYYSEDMTPIYNLIDRYKKKVEKK